MNIKTLFVSVITAFTTFASMANDGRIVGSVDTAFKLLGPDHKIEVQAFPDPQVPGVTCFVSYSKKGGITGALGLATDNSEHSIACRKTGKITVNASQLPAKDEVFKQSRSILFKKMRVVRMADVPTNTLIYVVYSDKLIDGSPKNSITAVSIDY
jgi:CreA protein